MQNKIKKCSSKELGEINDVDYCQECGIYMCDKCQKYHIKSYDHHLINLSKDITEIFTGLCQEGNHPNKLEFYCKSHNKLCCACCIIKKKEGKGQHTNCDVCIIEDIKE